MKNLKTTLALFVFVLALTSVNVNATTTNLQDTKNTTVQTLAEDGPGEQMNEVEERGEEDEI